LQAIGTMAELHVGAKQQLLTESTFTIGINLVAIYFIVRLLPMWFAQEKIQRPA
jgi:hypothetical protein